MYVRQATGIKSSRYVSKDVMGVYFIIQSFDVRRVDCSRYSHRLQFKIMLFNI